RQIFSPSRTSRADYGRTQIRTPDSFPNINDKYNDEAFYKWIMSKEYREYVHIPKFNVSCSANGQLVSYNPSDPDYIDQSNPTNNPEEVINVERNPYGYTKNYITYTEEVGEQAQIKLGNFILSGGQKYSKDGHGNLAPRGQDLSWNGK
ncbi:12747_t:CDS:2, partial [Dentiscutata heterogama]